MILLSAFINKIVNTLIRNLSMPVRITISIVAICVSIMSLYFAIKKQPKDKPGLKIGWLILMLVSTAISVLYLVL